MKRTKHTTQRAQGQGPQGYWSQFRKACTFFVMGLIMLSACATPVKAQAFVHPGLLQGDDDLQRMREAITKRTEPIYSGYIAFRDHPQSQNTYKMQGPMEMVGRNPTIGQGAYDADANAAYQNAVMWAVTGDRKFAAKAIEIVNAWSSTLRSVTGRDAVLMAGLGPFKMVNAAEILRYTASGWTEAEAKRAELHFKTVIYPVIRDLAPFANGNWDTAALKTMMAIAVFTNDRDIFNKALIYYQKGAGDGSLNHYIVNETGQCQESGRDQSHTQLGIAHLADCAEIAWHQGLDLYGFDHDLLLKGFEYTAKYNLGMDVPYVPKMDRTGKYYHPKIAEEGRNRLRAIYEEVYNHYAKRMNRPAPFTAQAAEKVRPELQALPGADHIGFGTFLYSRPGATGSTAKEKSAARAPGGLIAEPSGGGILLSWVGAIDARSYTLARAEEEKGTFRVVASGLTGESFEDKKVISGRRYRYRLTAVNISGKAGDAATVAITAGLPNGWQYGPLTRQAGELAYGDGDRLTIEAKGSGETPFLVHQVPGTDPTFIVRYVPQLSSQFTNFGISLMGAEPTSPQVSLTVAPQKSSQVEAPEWRVQLKVKKENSDTLAIISSQALPEPFVTFSRLTGHCWLKLEYRGASCAAFYSSDGGTWVPAGSIPVKRQAFSKAGIMVSSGLAVTTNVQFDHVSIR
ncbi:alginate lyase family protein [Mucilaginibacter sp. AW1-3]